MFPAGVDRKYDGHVRIKPDIDDEAKILQISSIVLLIVKTAISNDPVVSTSSQIKPLHREDERREWRQSTMKRTQILIYNIFNYKQQ